MRILQVAPAYYPAISIGGPIFAMIALEGILVAEGHSVDTLTTHLGLSDAEKQQFAADSIHPSVSGGRVIYKCFHGYPNYTFSPATLTWLMCHVNEYDVVLINGIWNFPILAAAIACKIRKVPYFVFPHGTLSIDAVELKLAWPKKILMALFVRKILKGALGVVFTTRLEERKVFQYTGEQFRSFLLPNVVNSKEFMHLPERGNFRKRYDIVQSTNVLIHYGRVSRVKGVIDTVRTLAAVRARFPKLLFVIAGGCELGYRQEIEAVANEYGVLRNILFTGLLQRSDGIAALVDADVFVLPSLSENFGMAVVEAMLCTLPVVISDNVGIAPDIKKAGAGVVVSLSQENEALVSAIAELLSNSEKRRVLGKRGREFAISHYDEKTVASKVNELLALV